MRTIMPGLYVRRGDGMGEEMLNSKATYYTKMLQRECLIAVGLLIEEIRYGICDI